ncbi:hypothetical protein [Corynebacterium ulceribovis]|uniref:hypothetical protein n=1 Tax=Corynebacterium ulceribovis TaxID=487732 RepID=UPI00035CD3BF|nr:hypothetical protein [Corynebacterium ulceribovis]
MDHIGQLRFADAHVAATTVRDYLVSDFAAPFPQDDFTAGANPTSIGLATDGGVVVGQPGGNDFLGDVLQSLRQQRPDCDWVGLGRFTEPIAADRLLYLSRLGMRAIGYRLGPNELAAPYDVQTSAALAFELANCVCDIHVADDIIALATPTPGVMPLPGLLTELAELLLSLPAATLECPNIAAYPPQFLRDLAYSGVNIKVTGVSFHQDGDPVALVPDFVRLIDGLTERFMLGSGADFRTSVTVLPQVLAAVVAQHGYSAARAIVHTNAQRWYRLGGSPSGRVTRF